MKRLYGLLLALFVSPAWAAGVHVDEIEYQDLINAMIGPMEQVINAVENGKKTYDNLVAASAGKTTAQLCLQLFPTGACTQAGDEQYDITADLQSAGAALNEIYNCATGGTCTVNNRFSDMRQFINTR